MTFPKLKKKSSRVKIGLVKNRTGFQTQEDLVPKKSITNFILSQTKVFWLKWLDLRKYSKFGAIVKT